MSRALIALLILTNAGTGYSYYQYKEAYRQAVSDKTTDEERRVWGSDCLDWRNDETKTRGVKLALGRSWKKHGQLVFEIVPTSDEKWELVVEKVPESELPYSLCVSDKQSGMLYLVTGNERDRWMFYE